ncbi:MAG: M10 family metallopeptidase C-terminal domain-containing protein [Rhodobacteraceae bacterium]|nr:M10 family metallopeptidase C-terminal domain-containing protein [Paracoccaceae bacterium]
MPNVYIIAGQSNAVAAAVRIRAELLARDPGAIVISVSSAGAPLTWGRAGTDWFQSGDLRDSLLSSAISTLRANPDATLRSLIWLQGEADTYAFARAETYAAQFQSLLSRLDGGLKAAMPGRQTDYDVVSVQLSAQAPEAPSRLHWSTIISEQRKLDAGSDRILSLDPDAVARAAGLSPSAMFKDPLHYSTQMIDRLAIAIADRAVGTTSQPPQQDGVIDGTAGADRIVGTGDDFIRAAGGNDTILAGAGDDSVSGGTGDDLIEGQSGQKRFWGGLGNDRLFGGSGQDRLLGEAGSDVIQGAAGADIVDGGDGDDLLFGGLGRDRLSGGGGNDRLNGGLGQDVLTGGAGADVFIFTSPATAGSGRGADTITDFQTGVDRIDLSAFDTAFAGTRGLLGGGQRSFWFDAASGRLLGDQNGDGAADWAIALTGVTRVSAQDFLL